jgi:hypothetical protein
LNVQQEAIAQLLLQPPQPALLELTMQLLDKESWQTAFLDLQENIEQEQETSLPQEIVQQVIIVQLDLLQLLPLQPLWDTSHKLVLQVRQNATLEHTKIWQAKVLVKHVLLVIIALDLEIQQWQLAQQDPIAQLDQIDLLLVPQEPTAAPLDCNKSPIERHEMQESIVKKLD